MRNCIGKIRVFQIGSSHSRCVSLFWRLLNVGMWAAVLAKMIVSKTLDKLIWIFRFLFFLSGGVSSRVQGRTLEVSVPDCVFIYEYFVMISDWYKQVLLVICGHVSFFIEHSRHVCYATHLHSVPRWRMQGSFLQPHTPSRRGAKAQERFYILLCFWLVVFTYFLKAERTTAWDLSMSQTSAQCSY